MTCIFPIYGLLLLLLAGMAAYVHFREILPAGKSPIPTAADKQKTSTAFSIPKSAPASSTKSSDPSNPVPVTLPEAQTPKPANAEKTVSARPGATAAEEPALSSAELASYLNKPFIIRFRMDSNEFSDDACDQMNRIANVIRQAEGLTVSVSGYTDSLGNHEYNRRLSEFRATVVKSYLVGQGVDPAQIATYGKGPEDPIESNETRDGRAANRRVEIVLKE